MTDGFRVVIVGGGFGGLHAAQSLRKAPIEITLLVEPDLTLPGHPEIFVIGDVAHARGPAGNPLPGIATVAIQQGRYVARLLRNRLVGVQTEPFLI
jgi:NADH dehydrogenase FAD-containing subunit